MLRATELGSEVERTLMRMPVSLSCSNPADWASRTYIVGGAASRKDLPQTASATTPTTVLRVLPIPSTVSPIASRPAKTLRTNVSLTIATVNVFAESR